MAATDIPHKVEILNACLPRTFCFIFHIRLGVYFVIVVGLIYSLLSLLALNSELFGAEFKALSVVIVLFQVVFSCFGLAGTYRNDVKKVGIFAKYNIATLLLDIGLLVVTPLVMRQDVFTRDCLADMTRGGSSQQAAASNCGTTLSIVKGAFIASCIIGLFIKTYLTLVVYSFYQSLDAVSPYKLHDEESLLSKN